jgi:hypothetical protein
MSHESNNDEYAGRFLKHSLSAQELISKKPSFIETWGLCLILLFVSMIFGISTFICLPEIVRSQAKLSQGRLHDEHVATMLMTGVEIKKVAVGMKVQLRFDDYPFYDFGHVNGTIKSIHEDKHASLFVISISLTNGLNTSSMKNIPFAPGLRAQALIITKYTRMSNQFIDTIISALKLSRNNS